MALSLKSIRAEGRIKLGLVEIIHEYATWNPLDKASKYTLSNGNLTATSTSQVWTGLRASVGKSSGKWY